MSDQLIRYYLKDVRDYSLLEIEDEQQLFAQICEQPLESTQALRERVVQAHMRMVIGMAKQARTRHFVPLLDLIQEGNVALLGAIDTFDPQRGLRFHQYARTVIHHRFLRAGREQRDGWRISAYQAHKLGQQRQQMAAGGPRPTSEPHLTSLNDLLEGGEGGEAVGVMSVLDAQLVTQSLTCQIRALLCQMPLLAGAVLRLRYGLHGNRPLRTVEIASLLNISAEAVAYCMNCSEKDSVSATAQAIRIWLHRVSHPQPWTQRDVGELFSCSIEQVRDWEQQGLRYCRRHGSLRDYRL